MKTIFLASFFLFFHTICKSQKSKINSLNHLNSFLKKEINYPKESLDNGFGGYCLIKATVIQSEKITDISAMFSEDSLFVTEITRVLKTVSLGKSFTQFDTTVLLIPVYFNYAHGELSNKYVWNNSENKRSFFSINVSVLKNVIFCEPTIITAIGRKENNRVVKKVDN